VLNDVFPSALAIAAAFGLALVGAIGTWFGRKMLKKLDVQTETLNKVEVLVNSNMTEAQAKITSLENQLIGLRDTDLTALTTRITSVEEQQATLNATAEKAAKEAELAELKTEVRHLTEIVAALRTPTGGSS
jgi:phage terminase small subunit